MTIEELLEIEAVRKLRLQYSFFLDAGELDALVGLFADDAVCEFGPYGVWSGREAIAANYAQVLGASRDLGPFQSLHANTNHWVELTGHLTPGFPSRLTQARAWGLKADGRATPTHDQNVL